MKLADWTILVIFFIFMGTIYFIAEAPPFNLVGAHSKSAESVTFSDFGDFISALIGIFSVLLLVITFRDQRRQATRSSFESNFYSLLTNHRSVLNDISEKIEGFGDEKYAGADFFERLCERITIDYENKNRRYEKSNGRGYYYIDPVFDAKNKSGIRRLQEIYGYYFHIHQSELGHYFRNLYHFFKFIIESNVDSKLKNKHIKILRGQLSNYELLLLGYNSLYYYGKDFKKYILDYELLKNLNFEVNLDQEYFKCIVEPEVLIKEFPYLRKVHTEQLKIYEEYNPQPSPEITPEK